MNIGVAEARERVRTYLQDHDYVRWGKHEINQYLHQSAEDFVTRVGYPIVSDSFQSKTVSSGIFIADPGFTVGETITGATTGTTAKVISNGTTCEFDTVLGPGFKPNETVSGASESGTILSLSYNFEVELPNTLLKITHVEVDGREVPIVTESEMRHLAIAGGLDDIEITDDKIVKLFTSTTSNVPKWRETTGKCKAIVVSSATSDKFRIYPIPSESQIISLFGVYRPLEASDIIPFQFLKGNITTPVSMSDNSLYSSEDNALNVLEDDTGAKYNLSTAEETLTQQVVDSNGAVSDGSSYPLRSTDYRLDYNIDRKFMNVLVYGALERAYLKEHDLRNVEKSEYVRGKKEFLNQEAVREDALNPASISGGINFNRLKSSRKWQYQFS